MYFKYKFYLRCESYTSLLPNPSLKFEPGFCTVLLCFLTMLIAKHLPSAKDARIYMSVERTYLGYIRLSLYTLSFAVVLRKLEVLADITQKIHVSVFLETVAVVLSIVGTFLIIAGILTFYSDIKYIEGGIEVSPKETTDPRIYMAAERTFLAWIRTSIALIVFGFVIEKFEFFLEQLEKVFNMSLKGDHKALAGVGVFIIFIEAVLKIPYWDRPPSL